MIFYISKAYPCIISHYIWTMLLLFKSFTIHKIYPAGASHVLSRLFTAVVKSSSVCIASKFNWRKEFPKQCHRKKPILPKYIIIGISTIPKRVRKRNKRMWNSSRQVSLSRVHYFTFFVWLNFPKHLGFNKIYAQWEVMMIWRLKNWLNMGKATVEYNMRIVNS